MSSWLRVMAAGAILSCMGLPGRQLSAADGQSEVDDKPGATAGNRQDAGEEEGRTELGLN